jgi:hypothetical protein
MLLKAPKKRCKTCARFGAGCKQGTNPGLGFGQRALISGSAAGGSRLCRVLEIRCVVRLVMLLGVSGLTVRLSNEPHFLIRRESFVLSRRKLSKIQTSG